MGAVKEHGEISTKYKVSKALCNLGLRASKIVVNPITVSTTAADHTPSTDNFATVNKSINSDYLMWIANHICKRVTYEIDCVTGFIAVRSVP